MQNKNTVENIRGFIFKKEASVEIWSNKILYFLTELKEIDAQLFGSWYEQGWSKKEAQAKMVLFDTKCISNIVNNAWDKKLPQLGSSFILWSGKNNEDENSKVSFRIGMTSNNKHMSNFISVSFPIKEELQLKADNKKINEIITLIKKTWEPFDMEID